MTIDERTFSIYRGKNVLLNSNLLLLYFIGTFERARIATFKRTNSFSLEDFDSLVSFLSEFSVIVTTPHILTEVNGLANALPEHLKPEWFEHFAMQTARLREIYDPAIDIMQEPTFNPLGLTDAAIQKASVDTLILTDDFPLSGYLRANGVASLNFRELTE